MIAVTGPVFTHYGDIIARLTGLSRSWIELVLLATAASLPELFTGLSAVTIAAAPNIAVGDALGACIFNLVILVVLDALSRDEPSIAASIRSHPDRWIRRDPDRVRRRGRVAEPEQLGSANLPHKRLTILSLTFQSMGYGAALTKMMAR